MSVSERPAGRQCARRGALLPHHKGEVDDNVGELALEHHEAENGHEVVAPDVDGVVLWVTSRNVERLDTLDCELGAVDGVRKLCVWRVHKCDAPELGNCGLVGRSRGGVILVLQQPVLGVDVNVLQGGV